MNDEVWISDLYFIVHRFYFIVPSHAAFFAGVSSTDVTVAPPALVPNLTLNVAHSPTAVERTAWIWYITFADPAGRVVSLNSFAPDPPRYSSVPASPICRQIW